MRMNNVYKLLFSDLEFLNMADFGDTQGPVTVNMFLSWHSQSKTAKFKNMMFLFLRSNIADLRMEREKFC